MFSLKKSKKLTVSIICMLFLCCGLLGAASSVYADTIPVGCPGSEFAGPVAPGVVCPDATSTTNCNTTNSSERSSTCKLQATCQDLKNHPEDCKILDYLKSAIKVLSGLVGLVVVIMITVGGIQYSSARDNPQAVAAARGRIVNALIALVVYILTFAILQFLIPGGVLQ